MVKSRVQKIFSYCDPVPDAILIKNASEPYIDKMFFYVTGLSTGLFEGCAAILFPDGNIHLLVSSLEADIARQSSVPISVYTTLKEFYETLRSLTSSCKTIGVSYQGVSYSDFLSLSRNMPHVSFQDISSACVSARIKKDAEELSRIQKACSIADRVMGQIPQFVRKGMTESELSAEIDYHLQKYGAQSPAFETISSFGKNTALPHYSHGKKILESGDFIVCDFGACVDQYNSDMTRTFVFGSASEQQKRIHHMVQVAQESGIQMIRQGVIAEDVHRQVYNVIAQSEFSGRFIHSTGHSLGLLVHDGGVGFHTQCRMPLEEHMVLTVEPGIYIPGLGGVRIEDDIVVTSDGCKLLTTSPRELIEI